MIPSYEDIKIKPKSALEKLQDKIDLQLFRNKATRGLKSKVCLNTLTGGHHIIIEGANTIQLLIAQDIINKLTNSTILII